MSDNNTPDQTTDEMKPQQRKRLGALVDALAELTDREAELVWAAARGTTPPGTDDDGDKNKPDPRAYPADWTV